MVHSNHRHHHPSLGTQRGSKYYASPAVVYIRSLAMPPFFYSTAFTTLRALLGPITTLKKLGSCPSSNPSVEPPLLAVPGLVSSLLLAPVAPPLLDPAVLGWYSSSLRRTLGSVANGRSRLEPTQPNRLSWDLVRCWLKVLFDSLEYRFDTARWCL